MDTKQLAKHFDGPHNRRSKYLLNADDEERRVTLDLAANGQVVVHTSEEVSATEQCIHIISARRPDKLEIRDYEDAPC